MLSRWSEGCGVRVNVGASGTRVTAWEMATRRARGKSAEGVVPELVVHRDCERGRGVDSAVRRRRAKHAPARLSPPDPTVWLHWLTIAFRASAAASMTGSPSTFTTTSERPPVKGKGAT